MIPELITTSDGSHSLHVQELNETYHSTHGALQESLHVFIRSGFDAAPGSPSIRVLEIGMGTGLNVLLTVLAASRSKGTTGYTAVEAFPLPPSVTATLNYPDLVENNSARDWFEKIHAAPWGTETQITDFFTLKKIKSTIQSLEFPVRFDVIYFDAFAPQKQPEMWTLEIFRKLFDATANGGVLVTYCAKGQVKRDLRTVGFEVESLAGPPGKREMIRARRMARSD